MPQLNQPLRFHPILKRIRWGGRKLGTLLGKPIGAESDYAESWELVDHGQDQSIVASGPWAGQKLCDLIAKNPTDLIGSQKAQKQFPLLIKFLDANDRLSVQVHPNDVQASAHTPGERGKTEAWVILEAEPGSCVFAGLKSGVTRQQLSTAIEAGEVESCLHRLPVKTGDCVFIPAGTVHALGEGVVLAEVQQSSDLTFRLFDWNRLGTDGKPRPLHIRESLDVIDFHRGPVEVATPVQVSLENTIRRERLVACEYFCLERLSGSGVLSRKRVDRFCVWIVLAGEIRWQNQEIPPGQENTRRGETILLPATTRDLEIEFAPGTEILEAFCP